MRLALTLIFSLFSFAQLCGQEFGDNNATWIYDHRGGTSHGVTEVTYDRDTLVNGIAVRIFNKKAYRSLPNEILVFSLSPVYIYDVDGVVHFSEDLIHFDTLYNFQAEVNESWKIPRRDFDGDETGEFLERTVLSRFSSLINGVDTPCLEVRNGNDIAPDTICQGIGSRLYYILPFDYLELASDGGEGGLLRCYSNDILGVVSLPYSWTPFGGTGSFEDGFEFDCDQISTNTSTVPISNEEISVFPNPASNMIHIQSEGEEVKSIIVYNLQGLPILEKQGLSNSMDLDISLLPSGMYFVLINEKYFEKVIVER